MKPGRVSRTVAKAWSSSVADGVNQTRIVLRLRTAMIAVG